MTQLKRVADLVTDILTENGIKHVFLVTGGGAMHLNDAIGRYKNLQYVACHHEQACSMAADSYFRMSRKLAAVNVTTGPGGTNAITGVFGAWTDSLGMVVISGQVKWETLVRSTQLPLRQLGDQEIDIIKMVESITKYAVLVEDPKTIKYHLEKAIYLAQNGRPGPVWIDIPINIQAALINPKELKSFLPTEEILEIIHTDVIPYCEIIRDRIQKAKRPLVLVGSGIRIGKAQEQLLKFLEIYKIPIATAWNAHDVIWDEHPYYVGRPGSIGTRAGNFAVQNSDLVIILGCRLNVRQVSYNWKSFARNAYKIMVDIDNAELKKPTLSIDLPIHADVNAILEGLNNLGSYHENNLHKEWLGWCKFRLKKYPTVLPEYWNLENTINPYCFVDALFKQLSENEKIVTADGTACVVTFQAAKIKKGQRLYTNSGCASMGYDLPAAIGAYFASQAERIIVLAGDGSIQMNLQELQTIVTYKIPAKIFVLNNQGYHSIRQTQRNFFKDNVIGCGVESGLSFPDIKKIAIAYGIQSRFCENHDELESLISDTLLADGPQISEIILDLNQQFSPRLSSKKLDDGRMVTTPLEDMYPFLEREELQSNLLFKEISKNV